MKRQKLLFDDYKQGVWYSLEDAVNYLIDKGCDSMLYLPIIRIVQYNICYRDYLRDNGVDALITLLIEEAPILNEYKRTLVKVREWGENPHCIGDYNIQCCHINSQFELYGYIFGGLNDFLTSYKDKGIYLNSEKDKYPCFDSYDRADENRYYINYFLSDTSFTEKQIAEHSQIPHDGNYNMATEGLQPHHLPMIYYKGEGLYMYLVTERKNNISKCYRNDDAAALYTNKQCNNTKIQTEMKTTIYNLVILDASGSMSCIKRQAINGFNETVQTIKAAQAKFEEQDHRISLVVFNSDETTTVYDRISAEEVKELNDNTYIPNCGTPLYDAIGNATAHLRKSVKIDDKVLVTIITDGEENSSREYNGKAIKAIIDELKGKGWVFTYIGANQDVEKVASTMGIHNTMAFQSDAHGTHVMFAKERSSRMNFFDRISDGVCNEALQENFFEDEKL